MKNVLVLLGVVVLVSGCGGKASTALDDCIARGISYYKEIGSYPKLTSKGMAGRLADDVVIEYCNRTVTAF